MSAPEPEKILHQLQDAIDRLRVDLARVEIWAGALNAFSQSVPDYETASGPDRFLLAAPADKGTPASLGDPKSEPQGRPKRKPSGH